LNKRIEIKNKNYGVPVWCGIKLLATQPPQDLGLAFRRSVLSAFFVVGVRLSWDWDYNSLYLTEELNIYQELSQSRHKRRKNVCNLYN